MDVKTKAINLFFRALRLVGVLALIYVCMVFYLALTERQNAYPRAIAHKEARESISGKALNTSCTLSDGVVLEGWFYGNPKSPVALYYPDSDEDGAQFLAELGHPEQFAFVTYNYRGSGNNKGTPSGDTYEPDAGEIFHCAAQISGKAPQVIIGRGTGAILATKQFHGQQKLVLIDPVSSIAEAISDKYRAFYPSFLVRARENINQEDLNKHLDFVKILADRAQFSQRVQNFESKFPNIKAVRRNGQSLSEILTDQILQTK